MPPRLMLILHSGPKNAWSKRCVRVCVFGARGFPWFARACVSLICALFLGSRACMCVRAFSRGFPWFARACVCARVFGARVVFVFRAPRANIFRAPTFSFCIFKQIRFFILNYTKLYVSFYPENTTFVILL